MLKAEIQQADKIKPEWETVPALLFFSAASLKSRLMPAATGRLVCAAGGGIVHNADEQNGTGDGVRNHKQERTIHNHLKRFGRAHLYSCWDIFNLRHRCRLGSFFVHFDIT